MDNKSIYNVIIFLRKDGKQKIVKKMLIDGYGFTVLRASLCNRGYEQPAGVSSDVFIKGSIVILFNSRKCDAPENVLDFIDEQYKEEEKEEEHPNVPPNGALVEVIDGTLAGYEGEVCNSYFSKEENSVIVQVIVEGPSDSLQPLDFLPKQLRVKD